MSSQHPGSTRPGRRVGNLLEQPAIAVRIAERGERSIAATLGIRTLHPNSPEQIGLVSAGIDAVGVMEHLANRDAAPQAGRCARPRCRRRSGTTPGRSRGAAAVTFVPKMTGGPPSRAAELDPPKVVFSGGKVGVEPPTQAAVEALGAIDVPNRNDHDLELHVDGSRHRRLDRSFAAYLSIAHVDLPGGFNDAKVLRPIAAQAKSKCPQRIRAVMLRSSAS